MRKLRAMFLDRDGVLNKAVYVDGKSYPPTDTESLEIVPGAREAIARLRQAGYLCICVTNQPDVARGTRTRENVEAMNRKVRDELELDDLFVCLHDNADTCSCRKPKPGMLLAAAEKWGIDLSKSWMLGDRETDMIAGKAAGCRTVFIASHKIIDSIHADFISKNIIEAVNSLLATS